MDYNKGSDNIELKNLSAAWSITLVLATVSVEFLLYNENISFHTSFLRGSSL